jgi:hypothetical protein
MRRFDDSIIQTAAIATVCCVANLIVVFAFNPLQDKVFPGLTQYLSLVFLPHGVKVLSTAVAGARAIPGLAIGSGISAYFFWNVTDLRLMIGLTLVAATTAWIVFELLHKIGFNAYFLSLTERQPPARNLIAAGILCSVVNGVLMSIVLAAMDQPPSLSWIILTIAVGDLLGLLFAWAIIKFSLHFMLSRST